MKKTYPLIIILFFSYLCSFGQCPTATATPATPTICSGGNSNIVLTSDITGTTFSWSVAQINVSGATSGSGTTIAQTLTATSTSAGTVVYTIIPTANGCDGAAITATVTVKPRPIATATNATQTICSGTAIADMVLSSNVSSTSFNWTRDNPAAVTGITNSGTGNISGTLTNTTSIAQTVTFTITPNTNGCNGTAITAAVTVNPTPNVTTTNSTQTACTGAAITTMVLSSNVPSTTFTWTRNNTVNVTGMLSGSGNISGTLTNTTGIDQPVIFTITPTANGCPGPQITATVTVKAPIITAQPVAPAAVCNGSGSRTISVTAPGATSYQWRKGGVNLTNTAPYSNVTSATLNITNPAASENGASFDVVIGATAGCTVTSTAVILNVSAIPTPRIEFLQTSGNTTASISACQTIISGGQNDIDIVAGTNPGGSSTYQWQVSLDNGVTWTNAPGPTSTTTQYVLNPVYTNYETVAGTYKFRIIITNNGCSGISAANTLTVSGVSNLTAGTIGNDQSSCGAGTFDPVAFTVTAPTGGVGSFTYQWQSSTDNLNFSIISGATASTYDAPSTTQTTYYRRIVVSGGCSATSNTVTVYVNAATPSITSASTGTICSQTPQNYTITSSLPASYSWTRATVAGIINAAVGAPGNATNPIVEILTNTTNAPVVVRYIITPKIGTCSGVAFNYDVTVTPLPTASIGAANQTICNGGTANFSVALTGTGPWNITYSNGTPTTVTGITASPYAFTVAGITTSTVYTVTALSDSKCTAIPAGLTGSATVTVSSGTAGQWTGAVSADWFDCRNWAGGLPSSTINAVIPAGTPNMPVVDPKNSTFAAIPYGNIASAQDLIIAAGATLTFTSTNTAPLPELQISRDWKNSGTFNPGTVGTVTFNGATANLIQTINLGIKTNETFYKLTINTSNGAKGVSVADKFDLTVLNNLTLITGDLRLTGEAQLIQAMIVSNPVGGTGKILIDQQGQKNSFNYNYWSSPVSTDNTNYSIGAVLRDGTDVTTNPFSPGIINFGDGAAYADGALSSPIKISNRWLYSYNSNTPASNTDLQNYYLWNPIGSTGVIKRGEGFTMKGTGGTAPIASTQNYVFVGKPNNGNITNLSLPANQTYLIGNPYPSALDANKFIQDNLKDCTGCLNAANIFNGALYFWDHFGLSNNHNLAQYVGGYATYSLMGVVLAKSNDPLTANTGATGSKTPKQYIPVAQGFFVDAALDPAVSGANIPTVVTGETLVFRNTQRAFARESSGNSLFMKTSGITKTEDTETDTRSKIRLGFDSSIGAHRQLLVGADSNATNSFDIGYDAPMFDLSGDDMFWEINTVKFVIQAIPDFNVDQIIPLGLTIANEGKATIKIDALENIPETTQIYLHDNLTTNYHNIKNGVFSIPLAAGEYKNRFSLRFTDKTLSVEENNSNDGILVLYSNNYKTLIIQNKTPDTKVNKVYLFNLLGQFITNWDIENPDQTKIQIPIKNTSSGVYIVKIKTSKGDISKKIIIK